MELISKEYMLGEIKRVADECDSNDKISPMAALYMVMDAVLEAPMFEVMDDGNRETT